MEIKVKGMRKIISQRMSESWHTSPRVVFTLSVDMTKVQAYLERVNEGVNDKLQKVTLNHVLMKVCAEAMKEYEYVNGSIDDENIILHETINIGLAVAVENGLIVPNVKDIGSKDIKTSAAECNNVVARARENKITMDDITGGTFTISNLGMMGIESFSPIINQPEAAILGVNKITPTPVVIGGEIAVRPMMNLNLVADHRIMDGAYAAGYLRRVKDLLETTE